MECRRLPNGALTIWYVNGDGNIFYDEYTVATMGSFRFDTENAVLEKIRIGGLDALLVDRYGYKILWFSASGEKLYQLDCNLLTRDEVIALAEAIENSR